MADTKAGPDPETSVRSASASVSSTSEIPAITFDRVTVTYGRGKNTTDALVDFNLRVTRGETVALLGPSGSGKSTALKALAGFVRPTAGRVRLDGRDVTDLPPAKRGLGVVVQSYALFPHMTVGDNVAFGLKSRRAKRSDVAERVREALSMVSMSAYADRLPRELSGGQQQRVAIARALAIRPKVLLLDEPLAALDAQLRQSMLTELQQLRDALPDTAMLYVTHDQSEALALADRIVVMRDARLVDVDTAPNLWLRPPTSFTANFLGGANLLHCRIGRVAGTSALVSVHDKMLNVDAPPPGVGQKEWAPGSAAFVCIRPHTVRVGPATEPGAMRARVAAHVWRGASTRLTLAVECMPDQLIEADVPGRVEYSPDSIVGVSFPSQAGVLVAAPASRR